MQSLHSFTHKHMPIYIHSYREDLTIIKCRLRSCSLSPRTSRHFLSLHIFTRQSGYMYTCQHTHTYIYIYIYINPHIHTCMPQYANKAYAVLSVLLEAIRHNCMYFDDSTQLRAHTCIQRKGHHSHEACRIPCI
jgi:hypothetical protein